MTTTQKASEDTTVSAGRADRKTYGPAMLAGWLGLEQWQFDLARKNHELVPAPDLANGHWRHATALEIAERLPQILDRTGTERPIGSIKAAARLAERTGLDVQRDTILALAKQGLLAPVDHYEGHPLYDPRHLDALAVEPIAETIAAQLADRLHSLDQAATILGVRRVDLDWAVAAGWLVATKVGAKEIIENYHWVPVPLFARRDLDALVDRREVDWDAVRSTPRGRPSLLRPFADTGPSRAQAVRSWVGELGLLYGIETWARYSGRKNKWIIGWEQNDDGRPTVDEVRKLLNGSSRLALHRKAIQLGSSVDAAVRWARRMLKPGAAVILDTETTGLHGAVVLEVAVLDAATGETLLDTLVHHGGSVITPGAYAVHGIGKASLEDAPAWRDVLPELLRVTEDRMVCAYNADFDHRVLLNTCHRDGLALGALGDPGRWECVMNRRSDRLQHDRWIALDGGHRALADCRAALDVLRSIAKTPRTTR